MDGLTWIGHERKAAIQILTVLLLLVTIAFIWILLPFYGAVFWAVILGILFAPMQRGCS
jgi:predicted PurR-regulated permease PerM